MSESTAKLKVTVKLHQQPLTDLPELSPPPPAPLSALRLAVAVLVILLAAYGGRWLYQQWPHDDIDYAAYAAPQDEPVTTADAQPRVTASVEPPTQLSSQASNPNSQSVESELPTSNDAKAQLAAEQGEQPSKPQEKVAEQPAGSTIESNLGIASFCDKSGQEPSASHRLSSHCVNGPNGTLRAWRCCCRTCAFCQRQTGVFIH